MTRDQLSAMVVEWQAERCLPSADWRDLSDVLLDALSDSWGQSPEVLREAVLAVAATLHAAAMDPPSDGLGAGGFDA